jgi:predicted unusual protein kinase regulating ubiquinone biosynthesis (AarF/ABC1/UbiB family)
MKKPSPDKRGRRRPNTRPSFAAKGAANGRGSSRNSSRTILDPVRRLLVWALLLAARVLRFCAWTLVFWTVLLSPLGFLTFATPESGGFYLARRAVHTVVSHLPTLATAPLAVYSRELREQYFFPALVAGLERSGAAYHKWGQWASTRPDLLPVELCAALAHLTSHAPSHEYVFTRRAVEAAVGAPIETAFEEFEREPFASGSIGQVHRARFNRTFLLSSGLLAGSHRARADALAIATSGILTIKVRHPNVQHELRADFVLMEKLAMLVEMLPGLEWLDASSTVRAFGWTLQAQADMSAEAQNARMMKHNFRRWRDVSIPSVVFATVEVLMEELLPGKPIAEYLTLGVPGVGPSVPAADPQASDDIRHPKPGAPPPSVPASDVKAYSEARRPKPSAPPPGPAIPVSSGQSPEAQVPQPKPSAPPPGPPLPVASAPQPKPSAPPPGRSPDSGEQAPQPKPSAPPFAKANITAEPNNTRSAVVPPAPPPPPIPSPFPSFPSPPPSFDALLSRSMSKEHAYYAVQRGVDIYYKMLLEDNLMHADMHPGNLMFSPHDEKGKGAPPLDTKIRTRAIHYTPRMLLIDNSMHADMHPGNLMFSPHDEIGEKELPEIRITQTLYLHMLVGAQPDYIHTCPRFTRCLCARQPGRGRIGQVDRGGPPS